MYGYWQRWRAWWLLGLCGLGIHLWKDRKLHMRRVPIEFCPRCIRIRRAYIRPTSVHAPYIATAPTPQRERVIKDTWVYDPRTSIEVQAYFMKSKSKRTRIGLMARIKAAQA